MIPTIHTTMRMNRFVRPQIFRAASSSRRIASTNRGITSSYPSSCIIPANDIYRRDITRVYNPTRRLLSSSASGFSDVPPTFERDRRGKRVWKASRDAADESEDSSVNDHGNGSYVHAKVDHWDTAVDDVNDRRVVDESLSRICEQVSATSRYALFLSVCLLHRKWSF